MPPVSTAMPADETPVPPSSDGGRSGERGSFRADEVEADEDDFDVDAFNGMDASETPGETSKASAALQ